MLLDAKENIKINLNHHCLRNILKNRKGPPNEAGLFCTNILWFYQVLEFDPQNL